MKAVGIKDFQAKRPKGRSVSLEDEEYFDFVMFSRDFNLYRERNGVSWRAVSTITGLDVSTLSMFSRGFQCSLKTLCKLADLADLSLDKYHRREFI